MSLACDSRVQLEEQTIQHLRERLEIRGIDLIGTKERVIFPFLTKVCIVCLGNTLPQLTIKHFALKITG